MAFSPFDALMEYAGDDDDAAVHQQDEIEAQLREYGRATSFSWLFDALGRRYRTLTWVIETSRAGTGPLLASNLPDTMAPTPGYPEAFQARSLQRHGEREKIRLIARNLDPMRLVAPHVDATMGAPVVWRGTGDHNTRADKLYVVGGNGRTLALLQAPDASYAKYAALAKMMWPELWPNSKPRRDSRRIVVRQVFSSGCTRRDLGQILGDDPGVARARRRCQLTYRQAQELAGATQQSLSGRETPLGEALSLVRSLGLSPASIAKEVPAFRWGGVIARDTVSRGDGRGFIDHPANRAFLDYLRQRMGSERYNQYTADPDNAVRLINSVLIGFLPKQIVLEGFGSEREERAMMAALPIMVTLKMDTERQEIPRGWELLPHLEDARAFVDCTRRLSMTRTLSEIERMGRQETLMLRTRGPEAEIVRNLADRIHPLGILLGLTLKRAERAREPSLPIESTLTPYLMSAEESGRLYSPRQISFGGAMPATLPERTLGACLARSIRGADATPIVIQTRAGRRQAAGSRGAVPMWH
jgi:hypothetical protein